MDNVKTCRECGEAKPLSDFYTHKAMADGHLNKCKPCVKSRVGKHREANIETIQAYDRKRGRTEERKAKNAERSHRYAHKVAEYRLAWIKRNPEKRAAHVSLNNAVRDGKVIKGVCEKCEATEVHAHHDDYAKPLDVRWLCRKHHGEEHWIDGDGDEDGR